MKIVLRSTAVAILVSTAALAAQAADLPPAPPLAQAPVAYMPVPPPYNWTGFYIGGNLGGGWSQTTATYNPLPAQAGGSISNSTTGFLLGGQIGANFQMSNFVVGVEFEGDWSNMGGTSRAFAAGTSNPGGFTARVDTPWILTVAGRFGWAVDTVLLYGKAGGGFVGNNETINAVGGGTVFTGTHDNGGFLVGGGVEVAFAPNWTGKVEYEFIGLQNWTTAPLVGTGTGGTVTFDRSFQTAKLGVNYKF
jgi:outer membrane immunogenic protein